MAFVISRSLNFIPNAENETLLLSRGESAVIPPYNQGYNDQSDLSISIGSSLQHIVIVEPTSSVSAGVDSNAVPISSYLDVPLGVGSLPDVPNSREISERSSEDLYGSPDLDHEIMNIQDSVSIENEYDEVEQAYQSVNDSIYYQVPSRDRRVGIALIVSLGFENNKVERYQAADEEEELVETFELLNYETITTRAHNRTLLDELRAVVNLVSDNDSSFVCCISSYGGCNSESGKEYIVDFDGTHVYCLQDVAVEIFSNCEKLERKPKMFFIQACRGPRRDQLQTLQVPARTLQFGPVPPWDFLFAYSTGPGCLSFRPELHGFKPYFFPILCQKLRDYYKKFDVVTILQMVNKEYSNYQPRCNGKTVRQVSWSNSSLRGLVFICAEALYSVYYYHL